VCVDKRSVETEQMFVPSEIFGSTISL